MRNSSRFVEQMYKEIIERVYQLYCFHLNTHSEYYVRVNIAGFLAPRKILVAGILQIAAIEAEYL